MDSEEATDRAGRRCRHPQIVGGREHELLTSLARHSRLDLDIQCRGDLWIDDHHTAEDVAICLGTAVDRALGDRVGVTRFGSAYTPLDEALARAVVDLSGRPWPVVALDLKREALGGLACENIGHVLNSFAIAARTTLHVDEIRAVNDHHRAEAAFKALALALRPRPSPTAMTFAVAERMSM